MRTTPDDRRGTAAGAGRAPGTADPQRSEVTAAAERPMHPAGVEISGVHRRIGSRQVLRGVGLTCRPGRTTALLGHNGSGKSTLLSVLLGLARADQGTALLDGRPLADHPRPHEVVGAVLDRPTASATRTARDHLRVVVGQTTVSRDLVSAALEAAGLGDAADTLVGTFSLGMRQRLAVASALLHRPSVLVMDEPHNGLDAEGVDWLHRVIADHAGAGGTALVATHRIREALDLADDVVVLRDGEVVLAAPTDAVAVLGRVVVEIASEHDVAAAARGLGADGLDVVGSDGARLTVAGASTARVAASAGALGVALRGVTEHEVELGDLVRR